MFVWVCVGEEGKGKLDLEKIKTDSFFISDKGVVYFFLTKCFQQPEHLSFVTKSISLCITFITINIIALYKFNFGVILETAPSSDTCNLEIYLFGLFEYILRISNFTSLILLLLFYLLYQHLLIFYPFVPYGNIFWPFR